MPLRFLGWGSRNFMREPMTIQRHLGFVAVLVQEGHPELLLETRQITLKRDDLFFLKPGNASGWAASDECRMITFIWNDLTLGEEIDKNLDACAILSLNERHRISFENIHAQVGQSPLACFHQLKMEKAKKLLLETDLLVKEIAFSLGYHQLRLAWPIRAHASGHPAQRSFLPSGGEAIWAGVICPGWDRLRGSCRIAADYADRAVV